MAEPSVYGRAEILRLTHYHKCQGVRVEPFTRDPVDLFERDSVDLIIAGPDVVRGQPFHLHPYGDLSDGCIPIEPQRIGAGHIGLGVVQFLFGHAVFGHARPFIANDVNGLGDPVICR